MLLRHFMQRIAVQYRRAPLPVSDELMDASLHYAWPGNLRELQNFVKRYLVIADEGMAISELQAKYSRKVVSVGTVPEPASQPPPLAVDSVLSPEGPARDLKFMVRNLKNETEIQAIKKALAGLTGIGKEQRDCFISATAVCSTRFISTLSRVCHRTNPQCFSAMSIPAG